MEHTEIVTATDLANYADRIDSERVIPELIWLLVTQSVPDLTVCRIPYGDAINQPGWDGLVSTGIGFRQFVPKGDSFWEIGTGANPQTKATKDFSKRTRQIALNDRQKASYVFVTPHGAGSGGWNEPSQGKWVKRRSKFGWQNMKILDAIQLADWLREFPAIGKWLMKKIGLVKSAAGFMTPTEHWENLQQLSQTGDPTLPHRIFLAGRDQACADLDRLFRGEARQLVLRIENEHDVEDYIAAYLASLDREKRQFLGNKCLFVQDADTWLSFANLKTPHVFVAHPNLDLESAGEQLHMAAQKNGHSIVIPVSGASIGGTLISLRSPSASMLETELVAGGYRPDRARELAGAGALSLSALKRHLRGLGELPPYATWESARALAQAGLFGKWVGENPADRAAMEIILGKSYGEWIETVRPETLRSDTPLTHRNENWKVISRGEAWSALGPRLTNDDLDRLQKVAILVLGERDPKFDLTPDERFAASLHGKVLKHSESLRQGIAETLALLGSRPAPLSSCSEGKPEAVAILTVRELLKNADWTTWASLHMHLPLLAEAAPDEFLSAVEAAVLNPEESPFNEVFAQAGTGWTSSSYISGLLWALETLAWHPDYLSRVTVLLGELAEIDPVGTGANRPCDSLVDIFLPWHPQTCAPVPKRKAAIEALLREQPQVGWKLLLALLPQAHGATSGTRKPAWRPFIPASVSEGPTNREYHDQITCYAELAIRVAATDPPRLAELIDRLPDLPRSAHLQVLEHLASEKVVALPESDRRSLWEALIDLTRKHQKYADAEWAMPPEAVAKLEETAARLAPKSVKLIHQRLFSDREFDLFDDNDDYEQQQRNLNLRRQKAISEILIANRLQGVLDFARDVASPEKAGHALGCLESEGTDPALLPRYLVTADKALAAFIRGYVWGRFWTKSWPWVEGVMTSGWTVEERASFFALLPFVKDAWRRAEKSLGNDVGVYWKRINATEWSPKDDLLEAAEKLLQYERPRSALACLYRLVQKKVDFPPEFAVRALKSGLTLEKSRSLDPHCLVEMISWLQNNAAVDSNALFQVEFAYLPVLDRSSGGAPLTLERRMAENPSFFCEVLSIVYRSDKHDQTEQKPIKVEPELARNVYRLLHGWRTLPGSAADGTFDGDVFAKWVMEMKQLATTSGHFRIAMTRFGELLAHSPKDPDGLWIHESVAKTLNAKDAADMREGFICGCFNMRGAHFGSAGREEQEIATAYRAKADALEERGYQRFAATVRQLANSYDRDSVREASRNILED